MTDVLTIITVGWNFVPFDLLSCLLPANVQNYLLRSWFGDVYFDTNSRKG